MSNEATVKHELGRNKHGVMASICTAPLDRSAVFEEEHDVDDPMPAYDTRAGCDKAMSIFQLTSDIIPFVTFLGQTLRLRDIPDDWHAYDDEDDDWTTDEEYFAEVRGQELEHIAQKIDEPLFVKPRREKQRIAWQRIECKRDGAYVSRRNHGRKSRRKQWRKVVRVAYLPMIEEIFDSSDTMTFSEAWRAYVAWHAMMVDDLPLNGTIVSRHNRRRVDQKALSRRAAQRFDKMCREDEDYLAQMHDEDLADQMRAGLDVEDDHADDEGN
jgi:hypothetical protein